MKKICIKCSIEKDITDFYKRSSKGTDLKCKSCVCEGRKTEYERSMARVNDKKRSGTEHRLRHLTENTKQFRNNNPEKYNAHNLVKSWVRRNKDKAPSYSFISGEKGIIHYHHFDYNKPYHIVPCTPLEHKAIHLGKILIEEKHIFICT